jgi:AbrB family looped-hinge helix DNA binding protein
MEFVVLSPKFQLVIPGRVREKMGLKSGEKLQVISFDDRIELVPVKRMRSTRGFLKGLDPSFTREEDDRA